MTALGRFILRAELSAFDAPDPIITYGFDLAPSSIFVVTEWKPPASEPVLLRISFPRVLAPIDLVARVASSTDAGAPGELAGLRLVFEPSEPVERLLERLRRPSEPRSPDVAYRVLLVEDNRLIRDVFAHGFATFFRNVGAFVVEHAATAEVAWAMLEATDYDLAIVDYFLPANNGAQLVTRMRGDARFAGVPIVAISVGGRDAREATMAAGADLFVDKPLVFRDLFSTLKILWDRRDADAKAARKHILVLDDSALALEVAREALEGAGYAVAVASDLAAFEERRLEFTPDLILVDVQMPEAYGDDVAGALRGCQGVQVPIVLLSSIEERELERRARDADVAGFIWKGAGVTELVRKCREFLESVE